MKTSGHFERELSNMTDQRDAAMQALEWAKKNHERELADAKQETFKVTHQIRNWLDEIPSSWGELGEIPISVMVGHALQEENKSLKNLLINNLKKINYVI